MSREYPQFKLRMPPDMHEKLKEIAERNGRSMNAEIIQIIQESINKDYGQSKIENIADIESKKFRELFIETVKKMYKEEE
ncbi:Arc family DNA-binding protein [Proteus mirabilis]|uniref:Arc-like DNA binding domain-containing protein n=1 Tax=Proteus mirabilis TaxID=584 RepID=A0AAN1EWG0_PROMI|nr:Arc family DNA-binding protein [Proteus mirabilis]ARX35668.1 hypothetical protein AM402_16395 [Proteus mirabilis]EJD6332458.1 Arc family DNA-binding protein [Proteus mirabilis]EJD6351321.1 Arc family DNA-binding protein [Proteus mirabilis]EJD6360340.1 Arc family DNA-binding protein [Proteus mirabilis]EJD6578696.1 Arc family DNA-binding protein [Proteus mirabilis]